MSVRADWLAPDWRIAGVGALMTTRSGGVSRAPYATMNVGIAVGDDAGAVSANRALLGEATGAAPVFLRQVHGTRVVRVGAGDAGAGRACPRSRCRRHPRGGRRLRRPGSRLPAGAAGGTGRSCRRRGACGLAGPVGWRGRSRHRRALRDGRVRAGRRRRLARCLHRAGRVRGRRRRARRFRRRSGQEGARSGRFRAKGGAKWHADLAGLARDRLAAAGVGQISGGAWCTVTDASRFFSYRRDGVTGRMAAAVWIAAR